VPDAIRRDVGVSGDRAWIIITGWNRFSCPGYDTRPILGREPSGSYGYVTASFFRRVRDAIVASRSADPLIAMTDSQ
jgi:hypothetical protein